MWPPRPPWPGPQATPLCVATAPNTNSCMAQGPGLEGLFLPPCLAGQNVVTCHRVLFVVSWLVGVQLWHWHMQAMRRILCHDLRTHIMHLRCNSFRIRALMLCCLREKRWVMPLTHTLLKLTQAKPLCNRWPRPPQAPRQLRHLRAKKVGRLAGDKATSRALLRNCVRAGSKT